MPDSLKQTAFTLVIGLIVLSAIILVYTNAYRPADVPDSSDGQDSRNIITFESDVPEPSITGSVDIIPSVVIAENIQMPSDMQEPTITQDHKPVVRYPPPATAIVNGSKPKVI